MKSPNKTYWNEYSNLQYVKHRIIREYLQGWFPKLGFWAGRILYVDTHAGRGKHSKGQEGSPLVALKTFFEHSARDKILQKSELRLIFIERDQENAENLKAELQVVGEAHPKIHWDVYNGDSFDFLEKLVNKFDLYGKTLAPSFMFIDPYGFKLPYGLLKRLKDHPRSELLVNVMWRKLNMAMRNPVFEDTLNKLFGCSDWQDIRNISDSDERAEATVQLLRKQLGAKWATYIKMLEKNGCTRYFLLHLTNSDAGRDLMKEVIWKCCPDGGYYARISDDPKQQYLIEPEPNLTVLKNWLIQRLSEKVWSWKDLDNLLREEIWLGKHLRDVIIGLRKSGEIIATGYSGRFSRKANPILSLRKN